MGARGGDTGASAGWRWGGGTGLTLSPRLRDLLRVLSAEELCLLERSLCAAESEDPCSPATPPTWGAAMPGAGPPAPWGLLEAPHTTPPPHTCTGRLGPPGAVESPGTDRHVGVCVGRERGRGVQIFRATPWVTIASPRTAPSPPEVAQGHGSRPRRVPAGRSCARTTAAPRTCCTPSSSASQVSERLASPRPPRAPPAAPRAPLSRHRGGRSAPDQLRQRPAEHLENGLQDRFLTGGRLRGFGHQQ